MDRRRFLQNLAATAAAAHTLGPAAAEAQRATARTGASRTRGPVDVEGHTVVCTFTSDPARPTGPTPARQTGAARVTWTVYEDLRTRDGAITFVGSNGESRVLPKSAEASFADEGVPPYLGLSIEDIGMSGRDLLAEKLLAHGDDPDPVQVRAAAPPQGSAPQTGAARGRWVTFVGTKEAFDVTPVYPAGSTRTWLPSQHFEELRVPVPNLPNATGYQTGAGQTRYDGLVGGWMPATRTVVQLAPDTPTTYIEHVIFGDVRAKDKFIIQTWHRSTKVEGGRIVKVVFGYTYPAYPPARQPPEAEAFYRALLAFADYWDAQIADLAPATLPDRSWTDLTSHCFAKELMIRPDGVSPKYGGVDRDYFGNEYDGFQDIFTSALYTNLEWGRFDTARLFLDDYFTNYVEPNGMINMRGPETGQFGLTLLVLAKYFHYTRDAALILKHRAKIDATAKVLTDLHDIALALPKDDPKHGLIQGWSESDACLHPWPHVWWQPYYANTAFAARGLKDIAGAYKNLPRSAAAADGWIARSAQLTETLVASMRQHLRRDLDPPYVPPMPGTKLPFREAMAAERPSPLQWPHRLYAELLQPDVLPADLANLTIDTLRHYGGTVLGVVANIGPARPGGKSLLGFISYGYAQMLLRLDRIEEYLLFLYSHRYHDHTRGSWTAGEVSGIRGGTSLFCIPAQQTIPLLVRWMLVLEDSDEERLYFGKGVPREWLAASAGKPIGIEGAPTKWGRVSFNMTRAADSVTARVELASAGSPREIQVKLRTPKNAPVKRVIVNGRPATLGGPQGDTVTIHTSGVRQFEVIGQLT
jgi:hypothetical protein